MSDDLPICLRCGLPIADIPLVERRFGLLHVQISICSGCVADLARQVAERIGWNKPPFHCKGRGK